jgi:hypothetical protein
VTGEGGPARRRYRAVAPVGLAALLATMVVGVGGDRPSGVPAYAPHRMPRFYLTAGTSGELSRDRAARGWSAPPWLQVHALDAKGLERPVESVPPPSASAGEVREILGGPGGTFLAAASRAPCETRLYWFRLTADGHVTGLGPVTPYPIPFLVAGLAISPDGRRIGYASAPCVPSADPPRPAIGPGVTLTVLDVGTGRTRTWTADGPLIVGEIVWARDNRTLGYATAAVGVSRGGIGEVTARALDADAPGTDLLGGRVLFRAPDSGTVTMLEMSPDGRGGYGMLHQKQPPAIVLFSFTEGRPMRVTSTIPQPKGVLGSVLFSTGEDPRYACLNGIDAFGRVIDDAYRPDGRAFEGCGVAYGY